MRRDLNCSLGDGAAFGGMVGFGETYFAAFVLAVGLGELTAGLVSSVPLIAGGLMQTVSPLAVRSLRSHKRWVVLCASIQALVFVPFVWAALSGRISAAGALAAAAVYWGAGLATGPAWNTWIGTLVPRAIRPRYFATRTRASQVAVFAGVLLGGLSLQWASGRNLVTVTFAVLFALAGLFRLISVILLASQSETVRPSPGAPRPAWRDVFSHLQSSRGTRLLIFLVAVQAAVQLAGPYFTPFMLEKLRLNYGQYVTLISVAFLSKVLALPLWGHYAHRVGAHRLLWIGSLGIVPLGAGWLVSQHIAWLLVLQVFGGAFWAAYELAFFLMFFESIPEEERTSVLTLYNLLNTAGWVGGSLIGGAILYWLHASYGAYLLVFTLSSVGRLSALLLLIRLRPVEVEAAEVGMRTLSVRPNSASLDAPVLPSMPDQTHERQALATDSPAGV
ncbi:MAG: MFS transporter [Pirellulaceae bacterium]|nr:MFS transporter [Pirellulaceae bacterium]